MHKLLVFLIFTFTSNFLVQAQYTETINSNRPGNSQGAFAVGQGVLQFETGLRFGHDSHSLLNTETDNMGLDYALRFGFGFPELEVSLTGSYLIANQEIPYGAETMEFKYRNFESNTLGGKYLVYDPHKYRVYEKLNVRSYHANYRFRWRDLIPAVSVYAGANLLFGENPYMFEDEPNISPKFALITQHNYLRWVFVMNFIADKALTDYPTYAGIFTLTHSLNREFALFAEYQAIKSDIYSDDIARFGGAYLIHQDFQVDLAGLINFKDTPSRWQVSVGLSYRLDFHTIDTPVIPKSEKKKQGTKEQNEGGKPKPEEVPGSPTP